MCIRDRARRAALAKSQLDQPALAREYLDRKLPAVFASHDALDGLQQVGADAAVVLELLPAIVNANASAGADVLMIGSFVGLLEEAPSLSLLHI